ncbi:IS110 family transposase [Leifsonia sp. P73]|uniref:IS110 family transposase n=1 Tax=Leifsonia sp. P73 TaxID=3423959 RepID=UPI003DA23F9C
MTIVADEYQYVVGVDTHAKTHTYAIVETITGRLISVETFPTTAAGLSRALSWIRRRTDGAVLAAVEGTNSYGSELIRALDAIGLPVTEARPPLRASRAGRGKSDPIDAEAAARSVTHHPIDTLRVPRSGKRRSAVRILLTTRRSMETQRTADRNALIALLRIVELGLATRRSLSAANLAKVAAWRGHSTDDVEQATARAEASRLARSVLTLNERLNENAAELRSHVEQIAPQLLVVQGIGPITAAVFITAFSHVGRVRSEAAFAALGGASPIPASSGNTVRHRLNRHGDRRLNAALDTVARVRMMSHPETMAYRERRLAEGRTGREIKRSLKRYIARQIYRLLTASTQPQTV